MFKYAKLLIIIFLWLESHERWPAKEEAAFLGIPKLVFNLSPQGYTSRHGRIKQTARAFAGDET